MKPTDENRKLPTWVVDALSDPNLEEDLRLLEPLAAKVSKHANTINGILSNKMGKHPNASKVIVLGVDMLDEVDNIKTTIDQVGDLDLESYFTIMSQVLESFEHLVTLNMTNLGNQALRKHLINMFNKTLLDTRALLITNAYLSKFWPEEPGDEPEPTTPNAG